MKFLDAFKPFAMISRNTLRIVAFGCAALAILVWYTGAPSVIPRPFEVIQAFKRLWFEEGLSRDLGSSLYLNVEALFWTALISLTLSYLVIVPFFRPLVVFFSKLRFLGPTGVVFIFTLIVGGGHPLKVWMLVFGMSVFFVTSMATVVLSVSEDELNHARTLRMSEWRVAWEVIILGTRARAFEVFQDVAAMGWMMLTMVEGLSRSEGGLGAVLLNQNKRLRLDSVFAVMTLVVIIGLLQDVLIGKARRWACPYADLRLARRAS
ncbi:MAG TPA: nitrate ABC transporter permease [Patescibacteria group bacterium]|nr:nitrate ABC transporter permease [Patescibacteria group bacterium]